MRSIYRIFEGHLPGVVRFENISSGHIAHRTADQRYADSRLGNGYPLLTVSGIPHKAEVSISVDSLRSDYSEIGGQTAFCKS